MNAEREPAAILREHVLVGGTRWDYVTRTTYATCQCGEKCYLVERPDHADHVASLLFPRDIGAAS